MDYADQALRGFLIGVLIALIVFYVLRPHEPYPRWVLTPFDQPWMLVVLAGVVALVFLWDQRVALLMVVFGLGVGMDVNVYGKSYVKAATEDGDGGDGGDAASSAVAGKSEAPMAPLGDYGMPVHSIALPNYPLVTQASGDYAAF
jgi:hypothetical protein